MFLLLFVGVISFCTLFVFVVVHFPNERWQSGSLMDAQVSLPLLLAWTVTTD